MVKLLEIRRKDVYGVTKYYPENEAAKTFAQLLNQVTLTERDLLLIKDGLGYELKLVLPTVEQVIGLDIKDKARQYSEFNEKRQQNGLDRVCYAAFLILKQKEAA